MPHSKCPQMLLTRTDPSLISPNPQPLLALPQLYVAYLHSNRIKDNSEIEKLGRIPALRKLTLHGNPVEEKKSYRCVLPPFPSCLKLS
jgi:hypothetical protein